MDFNFKKLWLAIATSLVTVTSVVSADSGKMSDAEKDQAAKDKEKYGLMNPSVRPADGSHVFLEGDLLIWQARSDGFEYAIKDAFYTTNVISDGEFANPRFSWDMGFRLGIGYVFNHDGWDINAKWTHFNTSSGKEHNNCCSTATEENIILISSDIPTTTVAITGTNPDLQATAIDNKWKLRLNLVDLELGREFMTSKYLYLRPHMGLRGASIKQKMTNQYSNVSQGTTPTPVTAAVIDNEEWTNNFKGVGIRGGLDSQWLMGKGFGLYGNLAMSLIYGRFHVSVEESNQTSATAAAVQVIDVSDSFNSSKGILDLALGIRWGHMFADPDYHFSVSLGWEQHVFFNQTQIWQITKTSNLDQFSKRSGDLSTQGITLGVAFDF